MPRKTQTESIKIDVTLSAELQKIEIKDGDLLVMKIRTEELLSSSALAAIRQKFSEHIKALNTRVIAFQLPPPTDIEFIKIGPGEEIPAEVRAELDKPEEVQAPVESASESTNA